MPTNNLANQIKLSIDSAFNQNYQDLKLIIIDCHYNYNT